MIRGYTQIYSGHEAASSEIAKAILQPIKYPAAKLLKVQHCIEATVVANAPRDILEQIIKDADLANLGFEDFLSYSDNLRQEWRDKVNEHYSDKEWYKINLDFMSQHVYFTVPAQALLNEQKSRNLRIMQKMYEEAVDI